MLTFEEKLRIIETFPQLVRKDVSLKRVNFQFPDSQYEKKNLVYHLHPNGNGFIYAAGLPGYETDEKGFVNIREFSEPALILLLEDAIKALSTVQSVETLEETWVNDNQFELTLLNEDIDTWLVYAGDLLDGAFNSYKEAANYLEEEGFRRK
ncbi:hypothetical protein [Exiguobacterium sp. s144]|uniref:hypothetical protein n=1 Tax=Exiguobacterium sp. s144 TaxID=2751195 RepID=UPI001BEC2B4D|nr:hypothetical protein [Exiguobacterium sp. s144]